MTTSDTIHSEPTVGKELPNLAFVVTDAMIDDYFAGLELDRGPFDRGEAPIPSMMAGAADNFHGVSRFSQDRGHLWMRQEWELRGPLEKDVPYVAHARIEDIYRRRDRTVVNTAMALETEDGRPVLSSRHHQSFLLDAPVEEVQFRDPAKKEGVRKFQRPDGTPLNAFDTTITLEMCGQYFHGSRSYHTDLAASQELGFSNVVVGGRMTMSYVGHLLEQHFGEAWWYGGNLDIKFTNPVWPDDGIRVCGIATGPGDGDGRDHVFAWIEKTDGTVVLVANASVPTP